MLTYGGCSVIVVCASSQGRRFKVSGLAGRTKNSFRIAELQLLHE